MRRFIFFFILLSLFFSVSAQNLNPAAKGAVEVICKITNNLSSGKSIRDASFVLYSLPDTIEIPKAGISWHSDGGKEGSSMSQILKVGKYLARVYAYNITFPDGTKEIDGVKTGNVKIIESDIYEPKWVEFEITEDDIKEGKKSLGTVCLRKKGAFKVPKPESVSRTKD